MTYQPGDKLTWFPSTHPKMPRAAVYVDACKARVRIKVQERDGSTRTLMVLRESIEKVKVPHVEPA